MDETIFKTSLSAIVSGEYGEADIKVAKEWLDDLNKKELSLKRKMEKNKNEFVKNKGKTSNELKTIRNEIKSLKNHLTILGGFFLNPQGKIKKTAHTGRF